MIHSQHATMHTIYIIHVLSIQIHNKIKMHRKNTKILMLKKCSEMTHQTELMNLMISCSCLSYIVYSEERAVILLINCWQWITDICIQFLLCWAVCSHWLYWYYFWGHYSHANANFIPFKNIASFQMKIFITSCR